MSKQSAVNRLYKLAKAEEERKKKAEAKKEKLLVKAKLDFVDNLYKKYLKANNMSSSKLSILDFMYLMLDDVDLANLKEKPQQPPISDDTSYHTTDNEPLDNTCLSVSMVKSTTKTNIKHNNREMTEKEKAKHTYIDYTKSNENKYLVKKDIRAVYHEEFDEALTAYNAKQKRKDRQIKDYYKHVKAGKRTALQHEIVVQIGDKENFESNIETKKDVNRILTQWFESFEKRNPQLKVCNAVIHNDETSPHMHINIVPVATGYTNGLSKQVSFDRAILNQNPDLDKVQPFAHWRMNEVDEIEKIMNEYDYICNKDKFNQVHTNPKS